MSLCQGGALDSSIMNAFHDPARPVPALTLTIKTERSPAVHLTYDPERPIEQSSVTVLDQGRVTGPWSFEDVVKDAFVFLLLYVRVPKQTTARCLPLPSSSRRWGTRSRSRS